MFDFEAAEVGSSTVKANLVSDNPLACFYIGETLVKPADERLRLSVAARSVDELRASVVAKDPVGAPGVIAVAKGVRIVHEDDQGGRTLWKGPLEVLELVPPPVESPS